MGIGDAANNVGLCRGNPDKGRMQIAYRGQKGSLKPKSLPGRTVRLGLQCLWGQQTHLHGKANHIAPGSKPQLLSKA